LQIPYAKYHARYGAGSVALRVENVSRFSAAMPAACIGLTAWNAHENWKKHLTQFLKFLCLIRHVLFPLMATCDNLY